MKKSILKLTVIIVVFLQGCAGTVTNLTKRDLDKNHFPFITTYAKNNQGNKFDIFVKIKEVDGKVMNFNTVYLDVGKHEIKYYCSDYSGKFINEGTKIMNLKDGMSYIVQSKFIGDRAFAKPNSCSFEILECHGYPYVGKIKSFNQTAYEESICFDEIRGQIKNVFKESADTRELTPLF